MKNNNPKEALDRVRLLMNYDPSKTSEENLQEQIKPIEPAVPDNTYMRPITKRPLNPPATPATPAQGTTPPATAPTKPATPTTPAAPANPNKIGNIPLPTTPPVEPPAKKSNMVTDQDLMGESGWFSSLFHAVGLTPLIPPTTIGLIASLGLNLTGNNGADLIAGRRHGVKGVVDALDGWVGVDDLAYVLTIINSLKGKCYLDDTQDPPAKIPAITRFLQLYSEDENGDDLKADIQEVGTRTLPAGTEKLKSQLINTIEKLEATSCQEEPDKSQGGNPPTGTTQPGGGYKPCPGPTFTQGCYNDKIKQLQKCLGLVADGKFGPKTYAAIKAKIPTFDGNLTEAIIAELMKHCVGAQTGLNPDAVYQQVLASGKLKKGTIRGVSIDWFLLKPELDAATMNALDQYFKKFGLQRGTPQETLEVGGENVAAIWYSPNKVSATRDLQRAGIKPPSQQPKI